MAPISLETVSVAQGILRAAGVNSVVTGDFGLSYHGVDIVVHDIELCVPRSEFQSAITALRARRAHYEQLPDITEPNFYHPYKQDAARFALLTSDEPFELHLVPEQRLGLAFPESTKKEKQKPKSAFVETGLTRETAHAELQDLCAGVSEAALRSLRWPALGAFLRGWLQLAERHRREDAALIYLMQAERLCDANDVVDEAWCETELDCRVCREQAKELVRGKQRRRIMSTWT